VITGELKSKIDRVWDAFWSGGISNPLEVIEQITYLMFIRRLEDIQTAKERRANRTGKPVENPVYTEDTQVLRWSRFTNEEPENMLTLVRDGVFPWLRNLGGEGSTYSHHMKDARFTITTSNLLTKVVDILGDMPLGEQDTKGDLYEYMLSKIATAGQNGQFRTPRHIIQLIVEMMAPGPKDEICDPACGTAGFLVASAEYVNRTHREALLAPAQRRHFNESMFHGFDFDRTMLRIGSMNMLQHEVESPDIRYRDSLAQSAAGEAERYSLILANPPFAGSLDYEVTAKDLQSVVKTKKTELLFLALFLRLLKPGGRAAVIVPWPRTSSARSPAKPWTRPTTPRTICRTCWAAGSGATARNRSASGPSRASASRRRTSPPRATTSASTATRRSSTTRSSTGLRSTSWMSWSASKRRSSRA
jgi:type I restriction enzyme M protein